MKPIYKSFAALALFALVGNAQAASVFATLNSQDRIIGERQANASLTLGYFPGATLSSGLSGSSATNTRFNSNAVVGFLLPTLSLGQTIDSATFRITVNTVTGSVGTSLHGLTTTNPDSSGITLFSETSSGAIATAFTTGSTNAGAIPTANVLSFIQSFYTGANPLIPTQSEVFFRMNPSSDLTLSGALSRTTFSADTAQLELDVIPEPSAALLGGLGLLALLRRRRN